MHRFWPHKLLFGSLLFGTLICQPMAAKDDPVQWTLKPQSPTVAPGATAIFELDATIQPGWHLYSPTTPAGGPIITKIKLNENPGIATYRVYRPAPVQEARSELQFGDGDVHR